MNVSVVDLNRQRLALEPGVSDAMMRVLEHGQYINGPELNLIEQRLAERLGVTETVACASGTDALLLMLRAAGIGAGDAVIVPSLTYAATAEAVALAGAVPVFADIRASDMTLCPDSAARAIEATRAAGALTPRAVMPVDLFSLPADHAKLSELCNSEGLSLFYDAAHSIGTDTPLGPCGSYGDAAATSFYPSKALGCFGDGGAVFSQDATFAARARSIANHGVGKDAPGHALIGMTARLHTLQAAVLLEKLAAFDAETARRRDIAARYRAELAPFCTVPKVEEGCAPVWSYFAIHHPARDRLQAHLAENNVGSVVYYKTPTHRQAAYSSFPTVPGGLPETEACAQTLLCLPVHPYLSDDEVDQVIAAVKSFLP
ncbi:MAG: DegT/DnrJ/EryC1/StrS family aminotransferase [Pseudomonadota bacterium]